MHVPIENKYSDISDIKNSLDISSEVNRKLLMTFLIFEVYMLVVVGSTNDLDLLVPNSKVHLPLLGINLPLFDFLFCRSHFYDCYSFQLTF